nr:uncharacterized protein LOC127303815 [Lolium perenne]
MVRARPPRLAPRPAAAHGPKPSRRAWHRPGSVPAAPCRSALAPRPAAAHGPALGRRAGPAPVRRASPRPTHARRCSPRPRRARRHPARPAPPTRSPRPVTDASRAAPPVPDEFVAGRMLTLPSPSLQGMAPPKFG